MISWHHIMAPPGSGLPGSPKEQKATNPRYFRNKTIGYNRIVDGVNGIFHHLTYGILMNIDYWLTDYIISQQHFTCCKPVQQAGFRRKYLQTALLNSHNSSSASSLFCKNMISCMDNHDIKVNVGMGDFVGTEVSMLQVSQRNTLVWNPDTLRLNLFWSNFFLQTEGLRCRNQLKKSPYFSGWFERWCHPSVPFF